MGSRIGSIGMEVDAHLIVEEGTRIAMCRFEIRPHLVDEIAVAIAVLLEQQVTIASLAADAGIGCQPTVEGIVRRWTVVHAGIKPPRNSVTH